MSAQRCLAGGVDLGGALPVYVDREDLASACRVRGCVARGGAVDLLELPGPHLLLSMSELGVRRAAGLAARLDGAAQAPPQVLPVALLTDSVGASTRFADRSCLASWAWLLHQDSVLVSPKIDLGRLGRVRDPVFADQQDLLQLRRTLHGAPLAEPEGCGCVDEERLLRHHAGRVGQRGVLLPVRRSRAAAGEDAPLDELWLGVLVLLDTGGAPSELDSPLVLHVLVVHAAAEDGQSLLNSGLNRFARQSR